MPSTFTHLFVSVAIGKAVIRKRPPLGFGLLVMGLAVLPDFDTVGLRFGIPYGAFWGHRGFMHSFCFAFVVSFAAAWLARRWLRPLFKTWWRLWVFLLTIMGLHPLLDAMTDGGLGVALFSPFDETRHFLPWRPIRVSPIGIGGFLTPYGASVILSELLWVWLPLTAFAVVCRVALFAAGRLKRPAG
jgi:inner membrane protein